MTTHDNPPPDPDAEPARDAWLSAALRHARDADAAPPAELSAQILRAARNAVKTPQTALPLRANPLMRWWSWLARPPIAAGFATVMVATVVGLMGWDRPLDEALPQRDAAPKTSAPAVTKRAAEAGADAKGTLDASRARDTTSAVAAAPAPAAAARVQRREETAVAGTLTIDAPEHWTWQRGAGPQTMSPALQRWLAQLERAARWAPATSAPPDDAERLQLARDGAPNATLALGTDAVWLLRDGAPPLAAPLAPEAAAALRSALDAATR
jgi:hypothetical protein